MLAREVPTSPKYRMTENQPPRGQRTDYFKVILFSVVLGIFAGGASALIFSSLLFNQLVSLPGSGSGNILRISEKITDRQNAIFQNWDRERQSLVLAVRSVKGGEELFDHGPYTKEDILGTGVILTDDGWLLFPKNTIDSAQERVEVILSDQRVFPIVEWVNDPLTSMVFGRIEANHLTPVEFFPKSSIATGLEALVFSQSLDGKPQTSTAVLQNSAYHPSFPSNEIIFSSEEVSSQFLFASAYRENSGIVTSLDGRVIGLIDERTETGLVVTPAFWIQPVLGSVFSRHDLQRVHVGVRWLNLERSPFVRLPTESSVAAGAIVTSGTPGGKSVAVDSPAEKAGLKEGDIIVEVNGHSLSGFDDLNVQLQSFLPTDTVDLTVLRIQERLILKVQLQPFGR